jgi:hypothetical protein
VVHTLDPIDPVDVTGIPVAQTQNSVDPDNVDTSNNEGVWNSTPVTHIQLPLHRWNTEVEKLEDGERVIIFGKSKNRVGIPLSSSWGAMERGQHMSNFEYLNVPEFTLGF